MTNYFMSRPKPRKPSGGGCEPGTFYVRFYSRDEYPWYQTGITVKLPEDRESIYKQFQDFIDSAEAHRSTL